MKLLKDRDWHPKYSPEQGNLVTEFYVPALDCAARYDRSTGYFPAYALALAARGIEGLVRNQGRMRLAGLRRKNVHRCVKFHAASLASATRASKAWSRAWMALASGRWGALGHPSKSWERPGRRTRALSLVKNSATRLPRWVIS